MALGHRVRAPWYGVHQRLDFYWRDSTDIILPRENRSTLTCLKEVENAVSGVLPGYPRNARLGSDLVTEKAVSCSSNHWETTCSVDGFIGGGLSPLAVMQAIIVGNQACVVFLYVTPKHAGMLFA